MLGERYLALFRQYYSSATFCINLIRTDYFSTEFASNISACLVLRFVRHLSFLHNKPHFESTKETTPASSVNDILNNDTTIINNAEEITI